MNISFLIITAIVNGMGLVASAAVGVVEKLLVFAFLPLTAFSSAVAAMTAQNIGAGRRDRAVRVLGSTGLLYEDELRDTRKVLTAAALTYVAGAAASILQLLRIILLANSRRD